MAVHNRKRNANARSIGTVLLLALHGDNASGYPAGISLGVNVGQVNSG
jgi:hypothetical protein